MAVGLACDLLGVAAAGGQQREVFGTPAVIEEYFDLVVADVHGLVATAGDEGDRRALATEESLDSRRGAERRWHGG